MTAINFHVSHTPSFRRARTSPVAVVTPANEAEYRNAHRVQGWAIAVTLGVALWAVPIGAVTGIISLF